MKNTKICLIILVTAIMFVTIAFAGCGGTSEESALPDPADVQEETGADESETSDTEYAGTAMDLLVNTIKMANTALDEANALPLLAVDAVTADNSPAMLGLLADDFTSYIQYAAVAIDETGDVAFQAAVLRCKNAGDTAMIEALIQENFDPGKWVFVFPDRALTSVSRPYILLAVGSVTEADAVAAAFKELVGGTPGTTVFYEGETGG